MNEFPRNVRTMTRDGENGTEIVMKGQVAKVVGILFSIQKKCVSEFRSQHYFLY